MNSRRFSLVFLAEYENLVQLSKLLATLHTAVVAKLAQSQGRFGVKARQLGLDWATLHRFVDRTVCLTTERVIHHLCVYVGMQQIERPILALAEPLSDKLKGFGFFDTAALNLMRDVHQLYAKQPRSVSIKAFCSEFGTESELVRGILTGSSKTAGPITQPERAESLSQKLKAGTDTEEASKPVTPRALAPPLPEDVQTQHLDLLTTPRGGHTSPTGVQYVLGPESFETIDFNPDEQFISFAVRQLEVTRIVLNICAQIRDDSVRERVRLTLGRQVEELHSSIQMFSVEFPNRLVDLYEAQRQTWAATPQPHDAKRRRGR